MPSKSTTGAKYTIVKMYIICHFQMNLKPFAVMRFVQGLTVSDNETIEILGYETKYAEFE